MSLFTSIASIFGAGAKKKAAQKAADAQVAAAQQGINAIGGQNATTQAALAPWEQAGTSALGAQTDLLGLGTPGAQQDAITALQASPLYQSLFRTGQETILQNGAATGGLRGGNIQSSLANFGSDALARVIQSHLQDLGGLSGQGLNATGAAGQFGADAASNLAQLFGIQGSARAGGILGKADLTSQQYSAGANALGDALSQLFGMVGKGGGGVSLSGGGIDPATIASAF